MKKKKKIKASGAKIENQESTERTSSREDAFEQVVEEAKVGFMKNLKEDMYQTYPDKLSSSKNEEGGLCDKDNCSYYVNKKAMALNKNKFLMAILVIGVILVAIHIHMSRDLQRRYDVIMRAGDERISDMIKSHTAEADSLLIFNLDNDIMSTLLTKEMEVKQMLELEYSKIQSEYTTLSLWAGIVMVVFLIISLYSIFKIDEIQKQSREELRQIRQTASAVQTETEKIDAKIQNAFTAIESSSKKELDNLSKEFSEKSAALNKQHQDDLAKMDSLISEKSKKFGEVVNSTTAAFQKNYEDYLVKMKEANDNTQKQFDALLGFFKELINKDSESSSSSNNG